MSITNVIGSIFADSVLRKRIFFLIAGLVLFRVLSSIPVPGVNIEVLDQVLSQNQFLGIFNIFSGGGLVNFSIAMLGVFPYITVAIVIQLLTSVIPRLHELYHEEGELGRKKMGQYIRVISVPVAILNATGLIFFFQSQGVLPQFDWFEFILNVSIITAGAILLMWIGELMTEFAIGNGISAIVFAGIVVNIPTLLGQALFAFQTDLIPLYIAGFIGILIMIYIVVQFNESIRPIPITYARHSRSQTRDQSRVSTYLPIKLNPVGVLPIIFGLTIVSFFQFVANALINSENALIGTVATEVSAFLNNSIYFAIPTFILIVFFTYFYTPIILNTQKMSENLQKRGSFIPGIRPGDETEEYISKVIFRVIGLSSIFLGLVTVIPFLLQGDSGAHGALFAIGGTAVLIVVSVILDIRKKIEAHILTFK